MHVTRSLITVVFLGFPGVASARSPAADTLSGATAPPPTIAVSGSASIASDYRFRGVSQSDREMAVQGGITVTHRNGAYIATWASNLAGWGTFGGANMELDLIGGYRAKLADTATLDVGLTWYMYPGGAAKTDVAEPYAKLTGTVGPATLTAGVAYAPPQQAIGRWYRTGAAAASGRYDDPGARDDNLYTWGDAAYGIVGTPFTARAHIGHGWGQDGLGPNATAVTPTGSYWDWSLGADAVWRTLTLNLSYVATDISDADAARLRPSFSTGQDGAGNIAGGAVVASLTAVF